MRPKNLPRVFTHYRKDGWPKCPRCGEDELYSLLHWDGAGERPPLEAYLCAGVKCYLCGFEYDGDTTPGRRRD
jgi:hypothetical protein